MKKYSVAIFDFDGVIANSESIRLNTYKILFKNKFNIDIEFNEKSLIGNSENSNLIYLLDKYNLNSNIESLKDLRKKLLIKERTKIQLNFIIKDIIEKLFSLKIPLFVASSSSKEYIVNLLGKFDLLNQFMGIFTSEDVIKKKPDPEIYLKIKNNYKYSYKDILVFEDSPIGVSAAKDAKMDCVAVLSSFTIKDLNKADFFINLDEYDKVNSIIKLFRSRC